MSIISIPFVGNSLDSEARTSALVSRVVDRIVFASHADDWSEFKRWLALYLRFVREHSENIASGLQRTASDRAARLRFLVDRIASDCADADIYSPRILRNWRMTFDQHARRVPNDTLREDLAFMQMHVSGVDREYFMNALRDRARLDDCEECQDSFLQVDLEPLYNGGGVCEGCRANHYQYSGRYEAYVHEDRARTALDERGRHVVVDEDDEEFVYSDEDDEYAHVDYLERHRSRGPIREYHSSKAHFCAIPNSWSVQHNRFLGVELEVECVGGSVPQEVAARIHAQVNDGAYGRRVFFERDGSLSNGFEVITQPMGLPGIRSTFEFLRDPVLVNGLRSHRTSTCGLHVHVSRTGLTDRVIARAVTFVNDPGNDAFVTALARRYNTGYCKIFEKDISTAHQSSDRYEAVNLTSRHTIEFRVFRGSLKFEAVIAAAEFVHALLEYCARPETGSESLTACAFLGFCATHLADDTATLRAYLSERAVGLFQHSEVA